jgi:hypothetical protein
MRRRSCRSLSGAPCAARTGAFVVVVVVVPVAGFVVVVVVEDGDDGGTAVVGSVATIAVLVSVVEVAVELANVALEARMAATLVSKKKMHNRSGNRDGPVDYGP